MPATASTFRDATRLTWWVTALLHLHSVICAAWIVSDWMQLELLASAPYSLEDAEANDTRQTIVGGIYFVSFVATVAAVAIWVYRANANARALGAQDMQFTPGWAVGWYFVPFACFWKPYQAMVEIFRASKNPGVWQNEGGTAALPRWWLFWVTTCIAGNIAFRLSWSARTIDQITTSTWVNMVASGATIASALLLAGLMREIATMQIAHAQNPTTSSVYVGG